MWQLDHDLRQNHNVKPGWNTKCSQGHITPGHCVTLNINRFLNVELDLSELFLSTLLNLELTQVQTGNTEHQLQWHPNKNN